MATKLLPDDLLLEILVRLPVSSLLRFRCVSRSWCTFITGPTFISAHIHHNSIANRYRVLVRIFDPEADKKVQYKLCQDNESMDEIMAIDSPCVSQINDFFRMVGCVNGLVCLSDDIVEETDALILWNPIIRRFLTLPQPNADIVSADMGRYVYGFGFDSLVNDYKVIRILYHGNQNFEASELEALTAIFRLSRGSWEINSSTSLPLLDSRQAYVHGVIHWLAYKSFILGCDASSEKFKKIMLPTSLQNVNVRNLTIAPWCGLLSIFESGIWSGRLCLWTMKDYGMEESWVKQFVIEYPAIVRSLRRNGNVILENIEGGLRSYNHKTNQIEDSKIPVEGSIRGFHMKSYLESLVLLDRVDAQVLL
uniref:F-box domain-containing protein n=1 Tax=Opuntia streptacantha TaxID=393608 RepID=A0A7C8ZJK2_OPUST